jgi:hypothetical protein
VAAAGGDPVLEPDKRGVRLVGECGEVGADDGPKTVVRVAGLVGDVTEAGQHGVDVRGHGLVDDLVDVAEVVVDGAFGQRAGVGDRARGAGGYAIAGEHVPGRFDDLVPFGAPVVSGVPGPAGLEVCWGCRHSGQRTCALAKSGHASYV